MRGLAARAAALTLTATVACSSGGGSVETGLLVFAAASLTETFTTIGEDFERAHPEARVRFNFGPSDGLATGIAQGARADVFASASEATMDVVARSPGVRMRATFARNRLIVIGSRTNTVVRSWNDVSTPGVKLVVAAAGVPAGKYARQALRNAGLAAAEKNIVSNEIDVKSIVQKVVLGEADAGIVYATDVTPSVRKNVRTIPIPDAANVIATYPIAIVTGSDHGETARAFLEFILGPARARLEAAGFLPP